MTDTSNPLTVDEAVAEFMNAVRDHLESLPPAAADPAPEMTVEAEAQRFEFAEKLLSAICTDALQCQNHRCRRDRQCRYVTDFRAAQKAPDHEPLSRRSRGARAIRHAIWLYMNSEPQR
jgi:hypothetical protein